MRPLWLIALLVVLYMYHAHAISGVLAFILGLECAFNFNKSSGKKKKKEVNKNEEKGDE